MRFLNYANGSRILEEMLQLTSKPEDHMQDQLRAIALRTDTHAQRKGSTEEYSRRTERRAIGRIVIYNGGPGDGSSAS